MKTLSRIMCTTPWHEASAHLVQRDDYEGRKADEMWSMTMTTVNPFFTSKVGEASISALFGTSKAEATAAITTIVGTGPTVSAAPTSASNAASGKVVAALMARPASSSSEHAVLPPINETASTPREQAIAEANAFMAQAVPDLFDRPMEPVTFSSGESAIAMGWSYIRGLQSVISAVNTANATLSGKSVETARSLFGEDAAARVQKLNEDHIRSSKLGLESQISSISRAFNVSGKLVETDDGGKLSLGKFTLTYDDSSFRAAVGTDQHAWITQNGKVREVSVHQVTADLTDGKLSL